MTRMAARGLIDSAYIDPVFDKFTYVINGDTVTTQYEDEASHFQPPLRHYSSISKSLTLIGP